MLSTTLSPPTCSSSLSFPPTHSVSPSPFSSCKLKLQVLVTDDAFASTSMGGQSIDFKIICSTPFLIRQPSVETIMMICIFFISLIRVSACEKVISLNLQSERNQNGEAKPTWNDVIYFKGRLKGSSTPYS